MSYLIDGKEYSLEDVIQLTNERDQLAAKCAEYLRVIQLNHKWHKGSDESHRYSDSELCAENTAALLMAMANDTSDQCGAGWCSPAQKKVLVEALQNCIEHLEEVHTGEDFECKCWDAADKAKQAREACGK